MSLIERINRISEPEEQQSPAFFGLKTIPNTFKKLSTITSDKSSIIDLRQNSVRATVDESLVKRWIVAWVLESDHV